MNKKILTLSLVAVAAIALSVGALLSIKRVEKVLNVGAYDGTGTIFMTKDGISNLLYDDDDNPTEAYFDLSAPVAFNPDDFTFTISDFYVTGDAVSVGGDHLFTVTGNNWYLSIEEFELKGTHGGYQKISYYTYNTETSKYDVIVTRNADYNQYYYEYDGESDKYTFSYIMESRGSFNNPSVSVDAISITYTCAA